MRVQRCASPVHAITTTPRRWEDHPAPGYRWTSDTHVPGPVTESGPHVS